MVTHTSLRVSSAMYHLLNLELLLAAEFVANYGDSYAHASLSVYLNQFLEVTCKRPHVSVPSLLCRCIESVQQIVYS